MSAGLNYESQKTNERVKHNFTCSAVPLLIPQERVEPCLDPGIFTFSDRKQDALTAVTIYETLNFLLLLIERWKEYLVL